MARFDIDALDVESNVRRARDTATGDLVVLECGLHNQRIRRIQAVPSCAAIASFERVRFDGRMQLVHPRPLEFATPIDEFDVAHAIGSLLDGLAWLHQHGVTHGAIDGLALTPGPTGGRLSLAGASSRDASATPEDDVYAAAALAFTLLVGETPGADAHLDPRIALSASPSVAEALRSGLHPVAAQRPTAASLATMVRGEWLPPIFDVQSSPPLLVRMRAALASGVANVGRLAERARSVRPHGIRVTAGISAAVVAIVLVGGFAAADQGASRSAAVVGSAARKPAPAVVVERKEPGPPPNPP